MPFCGSSLHLTEGGTLMTFKAITSKFTIVVTIFFVYVCLPSYLLCIYKRHLFLFLHSEILDPEDRQMDVQK